MDIPLVLEHGTDVDAYYQAFGQLAHVHFSDTDGAALGQGDMDLDGILARLDAHGYAGKIGLALWGAVHYPDPDTPLRVCRDWLLARKEK